MKKEIDLKEYKLFGLSLLQLLAVIGGIGLVLTIIYQFI